MKILLLLLALTSCQPMPPYAGITILDDNMYQVSELGTFGMAAPITARAANYCTSLGKTVNVISSSTQTTITGTGYPILLFKCN